MTPNTFLRGALELKLCAYSLIINYKLFIFIVLSKNWRQALSQAL